MPGRNFKTLYEIAEDNYGFVTVEGSPAAPASARNAWPRWPSSGVAPTARGSPSTVSIRSRPTSSTATARRPSGPIPVEGFLSHETALDLYELSDVNPAKIHVTLAERLPHPSPPGTDPLRLASRRPRRAGRDPPRGAADRDARQGDPAMPRGPPPPRPPAPGARRAPRHGLVTERRIQRAHARDSLRPAVAPTR